MVGKVEREPVKRKDRDIPVCVQPSLASSGYWLLTEWACGEVSGRVVRVRERT
jgi:hypothetical protein